MRTKGKSRSEKFGAGFLIFWRSSINMTSTFVTSKIINMKRNYLILGFLSVSSLAVGQSREMLQGRILDQFENNIAHAAGHVSQGGSSSFWEETFSNAENVSGGVTTDNGTWSVGGVSGAVWKHTFSGTNGCWSTGIPNPSFSTAANGYLIFDADSANCSDPNSNPPGFSSTALSGTITSPAIDLSGQPDVLLEFSHANRWCCQSAPLFFAVSGDDGNTWSAEIAVDAPALNTNQQATTVRFNVSNIIGGSANARIRFNWNNGTAYYWAIDDIRLVQPTEHDLILDFGYISHNLTNEEYGRVPVDQLLPEMLFGGMARNFGYADQSDVTLDLTLRNSSNEVIAEQSELWGTLDSPDTAFIDLYVSTGPLAAVGRYSATFEVSSADEAPGSPSFSSNTVSRRFEVTDGLYSLDGIGVHFQSQQTVGDIGNNSFTDADVDFMMMTYYEIVETMNVAGIEIMFAVGTQADASIFVSLHDTVDIYSSNVDNPIDQSDIYDITSQNVSSRRGRVYFDQPVTLDPGAYYAAVRVLNEATDKVVRIQDDQTIPQPFYASMIYHPGDDVVYTNGNAFGIRLLSDIYIGLDEPSATFAAMSVYPSPTNGPAILELESEYSSSVALSVMGVHGAEVLNSTLNVAPGINRHTIPTEGLSNGLYLVKVTDGSRQSTARLVVQH